MRVKRLMRRMVEKALDVHVLPVGQVALVFEWEHLRRFFAHFAVDCVFDVGANAGQYATMLRTRVGYRGPIVSYEPIAELAAKIRAAAALEHAWFVEELALDATEGDAPGYEEALEFYRGCGFEVSAFVPNNFGHFPRLFEIDCISSAPEHESYRLEEALVECVSRGVRVRGVEDMSAG